MYDAKGIILSQKNLSMAYTTILAIISVYCILNKTVNKGCSSTYIRNLCEIKQMEIFVILIIIIINSLLQTNVHIHVEKVIYYNTE